MDFKETKAYPLLKEFILTINNSIKNEKQIPIDKDHILFKIKEIIISTPLSETKGRYANPAMVNVIEEVEKLTAKLPYCEYLRSSFGNKIRMDFGTGHELNFLCFLYSSYKVGQKNNQSGDGMDSQPCIVGNERKEGCVINKNIDLDSDNQLSSQVASKSSDSVMAKFKREPCLFDGLCGTEEFSLKYEIASISQVSDVLKTYFDIIRLYISKFNVEAAGSRGCWSIDDFLLLPYLFGAAENFNDPRHIDCIGTGMFRDAYNNNTSVMLRNLVKLPWPSINVGMYKMYVEEVLGRHVVTQHFIYSDVLPEK